MLKRDPILLGEQAISAILMTISMDGLLTWFPCLSLRIMPWSERV